jgi:hypothetical protein
MELYAGLDLHSKNTFIGILGKEFNQKVQQCVVFENLRMVLIVSPIDRYHYYNGITGLLSSYDLGSPNFKISVVRQ